MDNLAVTEKTSRQAGNLLTSDLLFVRRRNPAEVYLFMEDVWVLVYLLFVQSPQTCVVSSLPRLAIGPYCLQSKRSPFFDNSRVVTIAQLLLQFSLSVCSERRSSFADYGTKL